MIPTHLIEDGELYKMKRSFPVTFYDIVVNVFRNSISGQFNLCCLLVQAFNLMFIQTITQR